MSITVIVLLLVCLANLSLGLFILLRNTQARTGQSFFGITILISGWAVSNYLTDNAGTLRQNILFNKLAYLFALLAIAMAAIFSHYFVNPRKKYSFKVIALGLAGVALLGGLSVSHYVAGTVTKTNGKLIFDDGPLTPLYTLIIGLFLGVIIWNLYKQIRSGTPVEKTQAKIIFFGFGLSILLGMATNAVIPSILSNFETAKYGPPLLSFLVVSSITYAIVRHQLFDIRPIVARSFAYVLTLLSLAAVYVAVVFGLARGLFANSSPQVGQQIFYVVFTLFAALSFQPIRRFFDKITDEIFFRDAYDSQAVLNRLNKVLTHEISLQVITSNTLKIICDSLRISKGYFVVVDAGKIYHTASYGEVKQEDFQPTDDITDITSNTVVIDELEGGKNKILLEKYGLSVSLRLTTQKGLVGYILLGPKQSGNIYLKQDIRLLSIIANELAVGVQNSRSFEEISRFNVTLQEKIEAATRELRKANTRLKELDEAKDEFISMASHQLRTPLTTVKGYLSMVLDGDVGPVTKNEKEMIQRAFDGAERMVYLISDLLNVSRLQSGKFVIENKPTDLAELVAKEIKQLQETAQNHQLKLTYHKPDNFPALNLDENKILQVVMNFLDNAIYYTPKGGSIDIVLQATDKEVSYTVTDTGLGVPKAEQHKLFAKFYRAGNARKMRPDGTGLGLFMAKKVIVAQGGAIIFKSTEGKGSTFGFSFPRNRVEAKTQPKLETDNEPKPSAETLPVAR